MRQNATFNFSIFLPVIISCLIYSVLICSIFYFIGSKNENIVKYTANKNNAIDVTLSEREKSKEDKAPKKTNEKVESEKIVKTEEKVIKESNQKTSNKKQNIQDLFKEVKVSKTSKEVKKVEENKKLSIQSRLKSENNQNTKSASDLVKSLENSNKIEKKDINLSDGVYDEFRGGVVDILRINWNETMGTQPGLVAEVKIIISPNGNFSYQIISLTLDPDFNQKLREFLVRMESKRFPSSPYNRNFVFTTTFKDDL